MHNSNTYVEGIRLAHLANGKALIVMSLLRPYARPRLSFAEAAAVSAALRRMVGTLPVAGLPVRLPITVTVLQGSIEFDFPPRNRIVGTPAMWLAFCDQVDHAIATVLPN